MERIVAVQSTCPADLSDFVKSGGKNTIDSVERTNPIDTVDQMDFAEFPGIENDQASIDTDVLHSHIRWLKSVITSQFFVQFVNLLANALPNLMDREIYPQITTEPARDLTTESVHELRMHGHNALVHMTDIKVRRTVVVQGEFVFSKADFSVFLQYNDMNAEQLNAERKGFRFIQSVDIILYDGSDEYNITSGIAAAEKKSTFVQNVVNEISEGIFNSASK